LAGWPGVAFYGDGGAAENQWAWAFADADAGGIVRAESGGEDQLRTCLGSGAGPYGRHSAAGS